MENILTNEFLSVKETIKPENIGLILHDVNSSGCTAVNSSDSTASGVKSVNDASIFEPLQKVSVFVKTPGHVKVFDGKNIAYIDTDINSDFEFLTAGHLGKHEIVLYEKTPSVEPAASGNTPAVLGSCTFTLDAHTALDDNTGKYNDLLEMLFRTMCVYDPRGYQIMHWNGESKKYFVPWILDHAHTSKGMQYFDDGAKGLVEMLCDAQKEDGMIWSWIFENNSNDHYLSAYGPDGFCRQLDNGYVVGRQPVENHCEYNFVDCLHLVWQSSGDDKWLAEHVDHAVKALNYTISKPYRYSEKFKLLIRAFTIDSWDFQAIDKYFIDKGLGNGQRFDAERTKFGVFFGDNHGYCESCDKLAEMLHILGRNDEAVEFEERAAGIRERLDALVWNGRFFRQREEEDPTVVRDFGVDIDSQMVMSNMYALNRGINQEQKNAIIAEYEHLRDNLPNRSPGEWYSIYPPFEKDFSGDCEKWQYMNAGVHGHAAGELVRGAYKCGHEDYATDVLNRLYKLGKNTTNEIIMFAYTGGYEPAPPAPTYSEVDISAQTNMDILIDAPDSNGINWMLSSAPFDMINLPDGEQVVKGVPYNIIDRKKNNGKVAAAISKSPSLPDSIEIPIAQKAGAFNFVHCTAESSEDPMAALLNIIYEDGSTTQTGIYKNKHVANWWYVAFPETPTGGVFWKGNDSGAHGIGVNWVQINNPHPEKTVKSLRFDSVFDGTIYALLGLSLASAPVYVEPPLESTGGPDNWSGGLIMAGVAEGLIGVENNYLSSAYSNITVSPRWAATDSTEITATTRLAASDGYVSYKMSIERATKTITGIITTSASTAKLRIMLPTDATGLKFFVVNGREIPITPSTIEIVESSKYATFDLDTPNSISTFKLTYSN